MTSTVDAPASRQTERVEGYDASTYGDRFADVYDEWYGEVTDADATADVVSGLARASVAADGHRTGRVLELGVGTGRLALPLADRGVEVVGVDSSAAMLGLLRAKPGSERIELHEADLADLSGLELDRMDVVLLAFNTFFNITESGGQVACLRSVASWFTEDGSVVIEAFVPADDLSTTGRRLEPSRLSVDEVVLTVSEVADNGVTVSGQHVHIRESGIRLRPWKLRMLTPQALDELADGAGLSLHDRWSDWERSPFDEDSDRHVSVYRRR